MWISLFWSKWFFFNFFRFLFFQYGFISCFFLLIFWNRNLVSETVFGCYFQRFWVLVGFWFTIVFQFGYLELQKFMIFDRICLQFRFAMEFNVSPHFNVVDFISHINMVVRRNFLCVWVWDCWLLGFMIFSFEFLVSIMWFSSKFSLTQVYVVRLDLQFWFLSFLLQFFDFRRSFV